MPPTKRGIYHNLKESKYTVSNSEIVFFFSSKLYMEKFLKGYENNRKTCYEKISKTVFESTLNMNMLFDATYYKKLEKRGFRVLLKGVEISWKELELYALRGMTLQNTIDWQRIQKPKLIERIKIME